MIDDELVSISFALQWTETEPFCQNDNLSLQDDENAFEIEL